MARRVLCPRQRQCPGLGCYFTSNRTGCAVVAKAGHHHHHGGGGGPSQRTNRLGVQDQGKNFVHSYGWRQNQSSSTTRRIVQRSSDDSSAWKRLLYQYFLWRKDTWSDLQLFMGINVLLLLFGGVLQSAVAEKGQLWSALYDIFHIVLGQELPEETDTTLIQQVFAVCIAVVGLASFALILALIEQVVLEVLEGNVRKGSAVVEMDHYVLLCWGESMRDLNQSIRIVTELCASHRNTVGGVTIAVLVQGKEKLYMESLFESAVPESARYGCRLVFRQGSPLDPSALSIVSVTTARTVIICGDYSQRCRESDAMVLRSALLVDEAVSRLEKKPAIVAEVQTEDGLELMRYSCSASVRPVATTVINSVRTARLLKHPVASVVSHKLFDHNSSCFIGIYHHDENEKKDGSSSSSSPYVGCTIGELMGYFEYAIPFGFCRTESQQFDLNPPVHRKMQHGESIVLMQSPHPNAAKGLDHPFISFDGGEQEDDEWTEEDYIQALIAPPCVCNPVQMPSDLRCTTGRFQDWRSVSSSGENNSLPFFAIMSQEDKAAAMDSKRNSVLICGWPGNSYSVALIKALDAKFDTGGSGSITILNLYKESKLEPVLDTLRESLQHSTLTHTTCDPRNIHDLRRAVNGDISQFSAAIVLSDTSWIENENSGFALSSSEMMRMDAMILTCQLNIRYLIEQSGSPEISIISEKLSSESICTRFEDRERLPIGAAVNSSSFSAKSLAQEALLPGSINIYSKVDKSCQLQVQDASTFAREGEEISFACLQRRCASRQIILLGYYFVPQTESIMESVRLELNPQGAAERLRKRVWNAGDGRCKLVLAMNQENNRRIMESIGFGNAVKESEMNETKDNVPSAI